MCFQGFAHCKCGHTLTFETECELATDHVFYIKVMCPNYSTDSREPNALCGLGKYYCKETKDGPFLENVHRNLNRAQAELSVTDGRLVKITAAGKAFNESADNAGVSQQDRMKHPAFTTLKISHAQLVQQRAPMDQLRLLALKTISDAKTFYARQAERAQYGVAAESFVEHVAGAAKNAVVTTQTIDVSQRKLNQNLGAQAISGATRGNINTTLIGQPYNRYRMGNMQQTFNSGSLPPESKLTSEAAGRNRARRQRTIGQEAETPLPHMRKSASPRKSTLQHESSRVRRSARVRDKKVSYAESEGSSYSRDTSPGKSDFSGFSPSKSDLSASPAKSEELVKRERQELRQETSEWEEKRPMRSTISLSNRIDDWKERDKRAAPKNPPQPGLMQSREQNSVVTLASPNIYAPPDTTAKLPTLRDMLDRAELVRSRGGQLPFATPQARPPTRHGPPNHYPSNIPGQGIAARQAPEVPNFISTSSAENAQYDTIDDHQRGSIDAGSYGARYGQSWQQNAHQTQQNMNRNWLINTPAFNFDMNITPAATVPHTTVEFSMPMVRSDSVLDNYTMDNIHSKPEEATTHLDYNQMRRSFGSVADLTPPVAVQYHPGKTDTDPKKRKAPASSPLLPSSKRVQLSLPNTSSVEDQDMGLRSPGTLSSPSRMQSQTTEQHELHNQQLPTTRSEDNYSVPAPILAPTAVMQVPSSQDDNFNEDAAATSVNFPEIADLEASFENDGGLPFLDIDWGDLIDENVI